MTTPATSIAAPPRVARGPGGYGWWGKTIARQLAQSPWLQVAAVAEVDAAARPRWQAIRCWPM